MIREESRSFAAHPSLRRRVGFVCPRRIQPEWLHWYFGLAHIIEVWFTPVWFGHAPTPQPTFWTFKDNRYDFLNVTLRNHLLLNPHASQGIIGHVMIRDHRKPVLGSGERTACEQHAALDN